MSSQTTPTNLISRILAVLLLMAVVFAPRPASQVQAAPAATTYYVSSVHGNDANDGLSPAKAFQSIAHVNSLALHPGDRVLFACGEAWPGAMLVVRASGSAGSPITYSSYPSSCANRPLLTGALLISGWHLAAPNLYAADLEAGANAGLFPHGINQLFRQGVRLPLGRWPNLEAGDHGYATIEAQPSGNVIRDDQLPAGNWSGAVVHVKAMRWYMTNRTIAGSSGSLLTLNEDPDCWSGNCSGWGYFIQNHRLTLDREGEWAYDEASHQVYLYTTEGDPNNQAISGSVVMKTDDRSWGGIQLGEDMHSPVAYIVIDNFEIQGWFRHGIASPTNLSPDENDHITIQNNWIHDVDAAGINLWTWVYSATPPDLDGWRGGHDLLIANNIIDGANHFGIDTPSRQTTIQDNLIRNIGLVQNLGVSGLGCGFSGSNCTEHGDGLRIYTDQPAYSGAGFTVRRNRFERIAYNGIDNFGAGSSFENNVFSEACFTKGDCGAIRLFGGDNLGSTPVHDVLIANNIILDTVGNTDGCRSDFKALFGFGLYIDHNARNIAATGNTIVRATSHGILYQDSTGTVQENTLFHNVAGSAWGSQVAITPNSSLGVFNDNIMVSASDHAYSLSLEQAGQVQSADHNRYDHVSMEEQIYVGDLPSGQTFAEWQSYSGKDQHSSGHVGPAVGTYELFYNDTGAVKTIPLIRPYTDLDGNPVAGPLALDPYSSKLLIPTGPPPNPIFLPLISSR